MQITYSESFIDYHKNLFDFDLFDSYMKKDMRKSIRVNALKITPDKLFNKLGWKREKIPWARNCFFIDEKYGIGATIEHNLGYYYVQESSSMIAVEALNPKNRDTALDLCAAPGSKTTQIAQLNSDGTVVANEFDGKRALALTANVSRMGVQNCIITRSDGGDFGKMAPGRFDCVLVDAPCSGVGVARKTPEVLKNWSSNYLNRISKIQKKLICSGFECLKKGGEMVYSTCSTPVEENEDVVRYLQENYKNVKILDVNLNLNFEKTEYGIRIYPWHNNTECAFISKIKKE